MRRLIALLGILVPLLAVAAAPKKEPAPLPESLEMEYVFSYESLEVGRVTKTLTRRPDGSYLHSLWMRATGIARAFTRSEWFEEGEFVVEDGHIRPRHFMEKRTGDPKRNYERRVAFDWKKSLLRFNDGRESVLAPATQDQGSIIYSFMIDPLTGPGQRLVPVTDGKDIDPYVFVYLGKERIRTPAGTFDTLVVNRLSERQLAREERCGDDTKKEGCEIDDFTVWVAPEKQYVAVKMRKRKKNQTLTLLLHSLRGL